MVLYIICCRDGTRKFKSCFRDLLKSGNLCAPRALRQERILQHGELVQIQAVEYREKQNKVYELLNKRLVSLISKEQEGEIEPFMFLRNVALNLELR